MKLIASWSGGKDSCFALHKAKQQGHTIQALLVMMQDANNSNFHMISSELLDAQSEAVGVPIKKVPSRIANYEMEFKKALQIAKADGAQGVLTGDIFEVSQHEPGWLERVSANASLVPVRPLWHRDTTQVLKEFINEGFEAIIVRTKKGGLDDEFLGRKLDLALYNDLQKLGTIDPCGERGEYHTFVTDGPIFNKRIEIQETRSSTTVHGGRLEITKFALKKKHQGRINQN